MVAASGGTVTLVDLNRILDPAGHITSRIGDRTVRWPDGIHVTVTGGEWFQHLVLHETARLVHQASG